MTVKNHLPRKIYILGYIYILIVNPAIIRKLEESFQSPDFQTSSLTSKEIYRQVAHRNLPSTRRDDTCHPCFHFVHAVKAQVQKNIFTSSLTSQLLVNLWTQFQILMSSWPPLCSLIAWEAVKECVCECKNEHKKIYWTLITGRKGWEQMPTPEGSLLHQIMEYQVTPVGTSVLSTLKQQFVNQRVSPSHCCSN